MNKTKFQIYRDVEGYFRWRLIAGNGEIVAISEAYTTKQNAINSSSRVKQIAWDAVIVDLNN